MTLDELIAGLRERRRDAGDGQKDVIVDLGEAPYPDVIGFGEENEDTVVLAAKE